MRKFRAIISILFLLILAVWSTQAQSECAFDVEDIIARVASECEGIDANQVCYGNRNVTATAQDNVEDFIFNSPGDLVNLSSIQSLIVDSVNADDNTWGVAQMRLLVGNGQGLHDVNMLLFGEFDVRNAVEPSDKVDLVVQVREKTIHDLPNLQSDVLNTVAQNDILIGLERLEDTSWLRVENPATGIVGWVERAGVNAVNTAQSVGLLRVQDATSPYFGAMQAFYFENGSSDLGCDNVESDGIIIQTPEGQARISLLINEVSVELVGSRNQAGINESGRAFIQADPSSPQGMSVNVLDGAATILTGNNSEPVQVVAGERTSIPISVNLNIPGGIFPSGAPANPVAFDASSVNVASLLPAVNNGNSGNGSGSVNFNFNSGSTGNTSGSSSGGGNNSSSSSGSSTGNNNNSTGSNNSGGSPIFTTTGSGSGNNNNTNSSSSSSSGSSSGSSSTTGSTQPANRNFGFGEQGSVIAVATAVVAAIIVLLFLILSTILRRR